MNSVVISKANYAPLVEQTLDKVESKRSYDAIDLIIIEKIKRILNLQLNSEELLEFVSGARQDGGLEMMLPGVYYENLS